MSMLKSRVLKAGALALVLVCGLRTPAHGADHVIPDQTSMEEFFWTYGCTPTASSMVLSYWDNTSWFGRLIDHYYTNPCSLFSVPNTIDELRGCLMTNYDTSACTGPGTTSTADIVGGLACATNTLNGYAFSSQWALCFGGGNCWGNIMAEINAGRPFVWSASPFNAGGHSVPAWGYRDDFYVILYDTWWPAGREDWNCQYYLGDPNVNVFMGNVNSLAPGGVSDSEVSLDQPIGGEVVSAGHPYTVWWYQWGTSITQVDLDYSTDGGLTWNGIAAAWGSTEGWNSYQWLVPDISTGSARVRIKGFSGTTYLSGDGSPEMFIIKKPVCSPLLFPTDRWQRVWYQQGAYCLGDGPDEPSLEFDNDWGSGEIAHGRSDAVEFSSSRAIWLNEGTYWIRVGSDDGVRLWVDDVLKVDQWVGRPYATDVFEFSVTGGFHNVRLDYFESGGPARLSFDLEFPDLVVQSIVTDPAIPTPGQPVDVTVTVRNQGPVAVTRSFFVDLYPDQETAPLPHEVGAWCSLPGLAAGETTVCSQTLKNGYGLVGTYQMWAQVDTEEYVSESDEGNNVFGPQEISVTNNTLTVTKAGTGAGTVTSSPAGILCGADCQEQFPFAKKVTLTAAPAVGSMFAGWSGNPDCTDGTVTMYAGKTCTATFTLKTYPLKVSRAGTGNGKVTSLPAGIACGVDCGESFPYNTLVTLAASANAGSKFSGWSGHLDCSDGKVTMKAARSCTATFTLRSYALTVSKAGAGSGTVTSVPAGIACGADCTEKYLYNTPVVLTAAPAAGWAFNGWSGDPDCADGVVKMSAAKTCTASFGIKQYPLGVQKAGAGSGTVTSSPAGIDCGSDCTERYNVNTPVTLRVATAVDSIFGGWSGNADCADGKVKMTAGRRCTATFAIKQLTLDVSKAGDGSGTVVSFPAGIDCGADCTEKYGYDTRVTLRADVAAGSAFAGWSGNRDCADGVVSMTAAMGCTATFTLAEYPLSVSKAGPGSGTVTSVPAGIDCGADCTEIYDVNTPVTLTPAADEGSTFIGWSGTADCADGAVTMAAARECTATFANQQYALNVDKAGDGSGTVFSFPAGIECGADCSEEYAYDTAVMLRVATVPGSVFTGWSGDPDCTDGVVSMTVARSCTATFVLDPYFTLTVTKQGPGDGTVTSEPAGIDCGVDCTEAYPSGTSVTLITVPGDGSAFAGWSGDADCADGVVSMTAGASCIATFDIAQLSP